MLFRSGTSYGTSGKVTIAKGFGDLKTRIVTTHEIGHATKSFFEREYFGGNTNPGPWRDHTSSKTGLMYPYAYPVGGDKFIPEEEKILKGGKYP